MLLKLTEVKSINCSFCKTEASNPVKGPAELSICRNCIEIGFSENCNFCGQVIGTHKGVLNNKILVAARTENKIIMCNECLQTTSESVVADRRVAA